MPPAIRGDCVQVYLHVLAQSAVQVLLSVDEATSRGPALFSLGYLPLNPLTRGLLARWDTSKQKTILCKFEHMAT